MLKNFTNFSNVFSRFGDLVLAVLVVCIIGLLIIPLPTAMVDLLISINLMISTVMLMLSLYLPRALAFSTFPSMLLFTTLYRLALNVTTTRLILLKADAGEIIYTFGNFVVGGNFIVGAVIFLIITIVQFVVIAKGAERVSEVAARFTLDAMPGKQMSIDADMRAGAIDQETAKQRRNELAKESQLYGAMDGAMKFVKGDAIAGLIMTSINIVGGICVGVFMNGKEIGWAITKYGILTIGDGLVSQIPALLVSITSGVIVTRVGDVDNKPLGQDIIDQFFAQPKSIMLGAVMLVAIGLIPEITFRYRSTYFNHIFSSGYSAGYYGYLWAEVLDKDAFSIFAASPKGPYDLELAKKFKQTFLEKGGSEEPMTLYKSFAGREPDSSAMLRARGLTE